MIETAKYLAKDSRLGRKTVVLTGALRPQRFRESDAPFNVGIAVGAVQGHLSGVLNDGLGDLLQYVDGKIAWFPPRAWVWLPGVYEWSVDAGEGDGHSTSYRLELSDDQLFTYTWQNLVGVMPTGQRTSCGGRAGTVIDRMAD